VILDVTAPRTLRRVDIFESYKEFFAGRPGDGEKDGERPRWLARYFSQPIFARAFEDFIEQWDEDVVPRERSACCRG